ncbi:MAG: 3-oxoacyl-[acyl-carrier-protein] reductase [archaeon]|nr:3-oxoacyl-[acyl-carrier-protein] reductase [archaeon]
MLKKSLEVRKMEESPVSKVALVTGSGRGIGRAIALELAKRGCDVVVNDDKNPQEGVDVVNEIKKIGQRALHIQVDVSDPDQVEKMVEKIINEFGRVDILVNNAGIVMDKKLENMSIEQWNRVIAVNLTGTFNCTKAVISFMKEHGGGKIINIASVVGEIGNFGQANYAASKGGVIAFTKTVAKEYAKYGICDNAIAPGFINTKMIEGIPQKVIQKILEHIPLGRLGEPEEVAKLVCFLASDDANYITGQVININGGMYM